MSQHFSVRNFEKFQHYKDRNPPWIRLYNPLLDDYEFGRLPDASKAHLLAIWLLASRYDNKIPYDPEWVSRRINATEPVDLDALAKGGFIVADQYCSKTLADCKQDAKPEERRVEEIREEKKEVERADARPAPEPEVTAKKASRLPSDWQPSDESVEYALSKGIPREKIPEEVEGFRDHWNSKSGKDATKLDWPAAWRTWVKRSCDWKNYKPPAPGGRPAEAVEFVCKHDPRWPLLAERYTREHGRPPPTMSGVGGPGRHFPQSWLVAASHKTEAA